VADHSFRTAVIGYVLAAGNSTADLQKVLCMCLFHDLPEARTGDHNYVNKRYVQVFEEKAAADLVQDLEFGEQIFRLIQEFNEARTIEARLSRDADQLDLILELKEQMDLGNPYADEWLSYAVKRLFTEGAKQLAWEILETDSTEWWFEKKAHWWINGPENPSST